VEMVREAQLEASREEEYEAWRRGREERRAQLSLPALAEAASEEGSSALEEPQEPPSVLREAASCLEEPSSLAESALLDSVVEAEQNSSSLPGPRQEEASLKTETQASPLLDPEPVEAQEAEAPQLPKTEALEEEKEPWEDSPFTPLEVLRVGDAKKYGRKFPKPSKDDEETDEAEEEPASPSSIEGEGVLPPLDLEEEEDGGFAGFGPSSLSKFGGRKITSVIGGESFSVDDVTPEPDDVTPEPVVTPGSDDVTPEPDDVTPERDDVTPEVKDVPGSGDVKTISSDVIPDSKQEETVTPEDEEEQMEEEKEEDEKTKQEKEEEVKSSSPLPPVSLKEVKDAKDAAKLSDMEDIESVGSFISNPPSPGSSKAKPPPPASPCPSPDLMDSPDSPSSVGEGDKEAREWRKAALILWHDVASHRLAASFMRPVCEETAPRYRAVVKRPMDLATIKRHIEGGVLRSTREVLRDLLLMCSNAQLYHPRGSEASEAALGLMRHATHTVQEFEAAAELATAVEAALPAKRGRRRGDEGRGRKRRRV